MLKCSSGSEDWRQGKQNWVLQSVVPFGAGPKVTGGLLMGRTDVFPEVGAAKHQYHNLESFSQRFWNHPGREAVYGITCL